MVNGSWTAGAKSAVLTVNGQTVADEVLSVTYTDDINGASEALMLGATAAARVRIVIDRPSVTYAGAALTIAVGGVPLGRFEVTDTSEKDGRLTLDAYDAMAGLELAGGYFPAASESTALSVVREICGAAGLTLGDVSGITDVAVAGLAAGQSRRETLGAMAAVLGRNAHIDREGRLVLRWYASADRTVTADDFYAGAFSCRDRDAVLEKIECSVTTTEETRSTDVDGTETVQSQTQTVTLTAGSGPEGISLACGCMTQAILDGIFARLEGFAYRPATVTFYGDCRIETGDILTVTDRDGQRYAVPVMQVVHSWDGGVKTTVTAVGPGAETSGGAALSQAVSRLTAELGQFRNIEADNIAAMNARFRQVRADQAQFGALLAAKADVTDLSAVNAAIENLDASYASIDLANVNTANISRAFAEDLIVRGGLVTRDGTAVTMDVTKYLTGVTIQGDVIAGSTIRADRLLLTGADGLVYELNATASGLSQAELSAEAYREKLDGTVLVARSVTAEQIKAAAITGNELAANTITAGNIQAGTITADKLAADLLTSGNIRLYGSMTVYTDRALGAAGGTLGYTAGADLVNSGLGVLLASTNKQGIVVASDNGVYLGYFDPDAGEDLYVDGGSGTPDTLNTNNFTARLVVGAPPGEEAPVGGCIYLYGGVHMDEAPTLGSPLAIAQGGTGARTAAAARSNLGLETVTTETLAGGYITAYRSLHTVTVTIRYPAAGAFTPTVNAWNTLATLSADFRPPVNIDFAGVNNQASSNTARAFRITTAGVIQYWADASGETAAVRPAGTITYIAEG